MVPAAAIRAIASPTHTHATDDGGAHAPALTWLREIGTTVLTFDRLAFEPGYALRCTVGVAIPILTATAFGQPALGVPAAIGAFITGFTSLQGIYRTRLVAVCLAAVGMSITSFVGAVAAHSTPALVAATVVAGYLVGTLGQVSTVAATVALNSFIAFILFSSQPLAVPAATQDSALVLAGGLIQATLILVAWPLSRRAAERTALADVYQNLAAYATSIAGGSPGFPPITPVATARQVLADPQPFASAGELARLRRLLEDSELIRRRLGAAAASNGEAARWAAGAAEPLAEVARLLTGERRVSSAGETAISSDLETAGADFVAHVRDALEAATMLATGRLPRFGLLSKPRPGPYVRNRIVWFGRDSFRFAVVLGIAMAIGRHFQADRGYWIPMTAALVLKPDFQTTFVRGFGRIAGTLVGAVVATVVAAPLRGHALLQTAGVIATSAVAYLTFNPNYALFTVAITSFVVIVLGMRGLPGTTTVEMRLLDTLAGGALGMLGYLALPSWERKRTRPLLADLLEAQRRLAGLILRQYADPAHDLHAAIEAARTGIWQIRTTVESSIDRTRHEPHGAHTIGPGRALRILAATQRFGLANLAFETAMETEKHAAVPELPEFAAALDAAMAEFSSALRESRAARGGDGMAAITARLERELLQTRDPAKRLILERLIAYGDAAAHIGRLVGQKRT